MSLRFSLFFHRSDCSESRGLFVGLLRRVRYSQHDNFWRVVAHFRGHPSASSSVLEHARVVDDTPFFVKEFIFAFIAHISRSVDFNGYFYARDSVRLTHSRSADDRLANLHSNGVTSRESHAGRCEEACQRKRQVTALISLRIIRDSFERSLADSNQRSCFAVVQMWRSESLNTLDRAVHLTAETCQLFVTSHSRGESIRDSTRCCLRNSAIIP